MRGLLVLLLLTGSVSGASAPAGSACASVPGGSGILKSEDESYRFELDCRGGLPLERRRIFKSTGQTGAQLFYSRGLPERLRFYDRNGVWTSESRFEPAESGLWIKTDFEISDGRLGPVKSKTELRGFDPEIEGVQTGSVILRQWSFDKKNPGTIEFIATYSPSDPQRILQKEYVDETGRTTSRIHFEYRGSEEKPVAFRETDPAGRLLTEHRLHEPFRPDLALAKTGLSAQEIRRRLEHQKNPDRFLIGVIDGGFDYNHPELAWKWWTNPLDPVDGADNDGNGWIDDSFGWDRESDSGLPAETSTNLARGPRPDSHGTHVAHIATRGLEGIALVGFGGDYTRAEYLDRISAFLKKHRVRIVNISIGLPMDNKNELGLRDANRAMDRMVRANPDTLFVVSAGNEGKDIDEYKNRQFPASLLLPNVIKAGSLNTDRIEKSRRDSYEMNSWSNRGVKSVDLLAPGDQVEAARIGGGTVVHSGTSMAAPYVVREATRLWMRFPHLKAAEIRDVLNRSAYPVRNAPVLSGGMIDLEAAIRLVETGEAR